MPLYGTQTTPADIYGKGIEILVLGPRGCQKNLLYFLKDFHDYFCLDWLFFFQSHCCLGWTF